MRHKYIFCGIVKGSDKISSFRLISSIRKYSLGEVVRVNIPDDLQIEHWSGDSYSTTSDPRTLDELGWDCYILYKGNWRKFNYLKQFKPCHWYNVLEYIFGLYKCYPDTVGYTDDFDLYKKYIEEGSFKSEMDSYYPPFKEDKKGLTLDFNLKEYPWKEPKNEEWFTVYKSLKEENKS